MGKAATLMYHNNAVSLIQFVAITVFTWKHTGLFPRYIQAKHCMCDTDLCCDNMYFDYLYKIMAMMKIFVMSALVQIHDMGLTLLGLWFWDSSCGGKIAEVNKKGCRLFALVALIRNNGAATMRSVLSHLAISKKTRFNIHYGQHVISAHII